MLLQQRLVSIFRICTSGSLRRGVRAISSSLPGKTTEAATNLDDIDDVSVDIGAEVEEGSDDPKNYKDFLNKIGYQYKNASPRPWLTAAAPFPMNESFKPPPPISNRQKETIWRLYQQDPIAYSVRLLAKRFNMSHRRVDAILRLKGMEKDYVKDKLLQTGFQAAMEIILSAKTHTATPILDDMLREGEIAPPEVELRRINVNKADILDQEERRDLARERYQRLYWESIPESANEPVLPSVIQDVKMRAAQQAKADADRQKAQFIKPIRNTGFIRRPSSSSLLKSREGRPSTLFVDVGAEFMDVRDMRRRAATSKRKATMRTRRVVKKRAALVAARRTKA